MHMHIRQTWRQKSTGAIDRFNAIDEVNLIRWPYCADMTSINQQGLVIEHAVCGHRND